MNGVGTRITARLVVGLVGALLMVGTAFAHSVTYKTSLTIKRSPTGTVERRTDVTIYGHLRSPNDRCKGNSAIQLIKVGKGVVARDRTGPRGGYSFVRTIHRTARWRTRFPGKVLNAVHPHNHVCAASHSKSIKIPVG